MKNTKAVSLTFEAPPSTNALYSGRRYKTAAYKAWIWLAGLEINKQHPQPIKGPFRLTVWLPGRCDLDNLKSIPDLLKKMGVIEDDRRSLMRPPLVIDESPDAYCYVDIVPL